MADIIKDVELRRKYTLKNGLERFMEEFFPPFEGFRYPEGTELLRHVSKNYEPEQKIEFAKFLLKPLNDHDWSEKSMEYILPLESPVRELAITLLHTIIHDLVYHDQLVQAPVAVISKMIEAVRSNVDIKGWQEKWPELVKSDREEGTHNCADFTQALAQAVCEDMGVVIARVNTKYLPKNSNKSGVAHVNKTSEWPSVISMVLDGDFRGYLDTSIHEITHHLSQFDAFFENTLVNDNTKESQNTMMFLGKHMGFLWEAQLHISESPENDILKYALYLDNPDEVLSRQVAKAVTQALYLEKHGEVKLHANPDDAGKLAKYARLVDEQRRQKTAAKELAEKYDTTVEEVIKIATAYFGTTPERGR